MPSEGKVIKKSHVNTAELRVLSRVATEVERSGKRQAAHNLAMTYGAINYRWQKARQVGLVDPGTVTHFKAWKRYIKNRRRNPSEILGCYFEFVQKMCGNLASKYEQFTVDEMTSIAVDAVIDCAKRYDVASGKPFECMLSQRVRGAIIDVIRKSDHLPRRARAKVGHIVDVEKSFGYRPNDQELADAAGVDVSLIIKWRTGPEIRQHVGTNGFSG